MRIRVDKAKCQGHGMCNAVAPTVYPLDERGYVAIETADISEADREAALLGAATCPERAILIEEDIEAKE